MTEQKQQYLEVGKILNTHGVRGELKCESWCDEPEDLCALDSVTVAGKAYAVTRSRIHGNFVLLTLEGIASIDDAMPLKGKVLTAPREVFQLQEGVHFVVDLIGLEARDADTGAVLGTVSDILTYPAHDIYVIRSAEGERMIPDVPAFVRGIHAEEGYIDFTPLEGM